MIFCLKSQAKEYFVSPKGSDAADGLSEVTSFATIAKGVSGLVAGDTLTILPGTYQESVETSVSGSLEAPIIIRAQRPGTVLLRGDRDVQGFQPVKNHPYVYVATFAQSAEGVSERSTRHTYTPKLTLEEVSLFADSYLQDESKGLLYIHTSDSSAPKGHAIVASVTNGFGLLFTPPQGEKNVHDIVVDGLAFTGYQSRNPAVKGGSRARWGLAFDYPERVTVRNCTAFLNGGGIFMLLGKNSTIENCYSFGNFARFLDFGNNILGWSPQNLTFRKNRVEGFRQDENNGSRSDITFYSGVVNGVMEDNLAINAGIMIKGFDSNVSHPQQDNNKVIGEGAYYYMPQNESNLLLSDYLSPDAVKKYADPRHYDFRLQVPVVLAGKTQVFYVSPSGDDHASGTSLATAWKTLSHAAQAACPGQTIYITAGVYEESLIPERSGTKEAPIRFLRYAHDHVVLTGNGKLSEGIQLSGKSNIEINGLEIKDFTGNGVAIRGGENIRVDSGIVTGCAQAVSAERVRSLVLSYDLFINYEKAGVVLKDCVEPTLTGDILDQGKGPALVCDAESLKTFWSDYNAISPLASPVATVGGKTVRTFKDWQKMTSQDAHSLNVSPEYHDRDKQDYALEDDSLLIGQGIFSAPIGPYHKVEVSVPLQLAKQKVHSLTATTANLEWWTPSFEGNLTLHWGEKVNCENTMLVPGSLFHTVSLIGLIPGKPYYYYVTAVGTPKASRWTSYDLPAKEETLEPDVKTFTTLAKDMPPQTFHVSPSGDDTHTGLSLDQSWKTLIHASDEVRAGDTVVIHSGTYAEYVIVRATGDAGQPVTYTAAPGEQVWMDGVDRTRSTAFRISNKSYVNIDGIHFRDFNFVPHADDVINIFGGTHLTVSRCFYDGRIKADGYMAIFVRAESTSNLLIENCVMINGMGEGMFLNQCRATVIRNCVFYINYIRALSDMWWPIADKVDDHVLTFSHNLVCDTIPSKQNPFLRIMGLENLKSDHNGFFARLGPDKRTIIEATRKQETILKLNEAQAAGVDKSSIFGNPNIPVVKELLPLKSPSDRGNVGVELHVEKGVRQPLDIKDFFADPAGPFGKADDGKPIGLDPAAFVVGTKK